MRTRPKGSPVPIGSRSDELRQRTTALGDVNMQRGGISLGRVEPGQSGGALDYEHVKLKLAGSVSDYTVNHGRGVVPGLVERVEHTSPGGAVYAVNPIDKHKWTFSTVRVRVTETTGAGVTAGDTILLRIGGTKAGG